jgi:ABC-2 type transport system permease protein
LLLLAESLLYALVGLAIGVLVASKTTSQRAAMLTALLATLLPSTILSGMIFPIASMAKPLQILTNVVPARWFITIARGIMLKGVGLTYLWRETLVLLVMMALAIGVAIRSFKPRMA